MGLFVTLSITGPNAVKMSAAFFCYAERHVLYCHAECYYTECWVFIVMLEIVILSVVFLLLC
jgi:hypothetical protein